MMNSCAVVIAITAILVRTASGSTVPPDAPNQPPFPLSSLEERCDDQTAAGIVSSVEPEYHFTLRPRGEINLPPEIPLTIRVAYRGGALTCYPAIIPPPWSTRPQIAAQVGVVMEMQFLTAGGAFNEQFEGRARHVMVYNFARGRASETTRDAAMKSQGQHAITGTRALCFAS